MPMTDSRNNEEIELKMLKTRDEIWHLQISIPTDAESFVVKKFDLHLSYDSSVLSPVVPGLFRERTVMRSKLDFQVQTKSILAIQHVVPFFIYYRNC